MRLVSKTLEPTLTREDRRVLAAVPPGNTEAIVRGGDNAPRTLWQIGERLDARDLDDLAATLRGLEHLGYVAIMIPAHGGGPVLYRTVKGDEALVEL